MAKQCKTPRKANHVRRPIGKEGAVKAPSHPKGTSSVPPAPPTARFCLFQNHGQGVTTSRDMKRDELVTTNGILECLKTPAAARAVRLKLADWLNAAKPGDRILICGEQLYAIALSGEQHVIRVQVSEHVEMERESLP